MNKTFILVIILLYACFLLSFSQDNIKIPEAADYIQTLSTRTYLFHDWKYRTGDAKEYALREYDDSDWESMDLPVSNFTYDISISYFFWFRKGFYVSEELKGQSLGYACGKLPEATQLYLNGSLIGTSGSMPPDDYFGTSAIPRSYLFPGGLLHYDRENVIAMRVYTEKTAYADLKLPFITNNKDRLHTYFFQFSVNVLIPMIIVFLSLLVASYFLLMYLRNREERFHLSICIALFLISLYSTGLFAEDFPFGYLFATKTWYCALFLAQLFFVFYFQEFYRIHSSRIVKLCLSVLTTGSCLFLIFAGSVDYAYFLINRILYLGLVSPVNLYLLFLSIYAIKKGNQYAKVLLAGLSIIIITATHDIIYANLKIEPPLWLTNSGIVLYILSMFLTSANRFVDTKKQVDILNIELTQQKNAFFRFVPTQFLSLLGKQSAIDITVGDSSARSMTVLFSDIRKFTTISEEMTPEESFHLLNQYLFRMESPISENEGFVDKYVGDAIMALFSESPLDISTGKGRSSADRAVSAAIGMRLQLDEFNKNFEYAREQPLNIGIGINTGPLMLGTVGNTRRLDTTVIGDSVNLASRLENLTQFYKASIIISEWTFKNLTSPDSICIREIDLVTVKGKAELCTIYEVFEVDMENIKELKNRSKEIINTGIKRYKSQKFKEALTYFKEARAVYPQDIIPLLYIKRCVAYIKNPPPKNWSGVFTILE
ncbi:MAG: adenylate/guanylate cyclase domain-containing protein [Spirochaetales bacterium]|nr:adenylate/guanylate cyclase domain-containing protein [Spirochaetales bacterium]